MMNVRVAVWIVCAAAYAGHHTAIAQERLTIGQVAVLAQPKGEADLARLERAIADPEDDVRAVAARVVQFLQVKPLVPKIADTLDREQDPRAGAEQARALLCLEGLYRLSAVQQAAARLRGPVALVLAEWLARMEPVWFAADLRDLVRLVPEKGERLGGLAAVASAQHASERGRISRALAAAGSKEAWRAYLDRSRTVDGLDGADLLAVGLTAAEASIREETVWFAVASLAAGRTVAIARFLEPAAAAPTSDTNWTMFGRELLARRASGKVARDFSAGLAELAAEHVADARSAGNFGELTAGEWKAIHDALPDLAKARTPSPLVMDVGNVSTPVRIISLPVPGMLASVAEAVGCELSSNEDSFGAAQVTYHADGRPTHMGVDASRLTPACAQMLTAVTSLSVAAATDAVLAGTVEWVYVPTHRDVVSCVDAPEAPRRAVQLGRGEAIKPPKKTRNVAPRYPESMQRARIQGVVEVEAIISVAGCVREARVVRGVQPPLDFAALAAVSGWQFTPTLLRGTPVPVIMTVTVNFTLQ